MLGVNHQCSDISEKEQMADVYHVFLCVQSDVCKSAQDIGSLEAPVYRHS